MKAVEYLGWGNYHDAVADSARQMYQQPPMSMTVYFWTINFGLNSRTDMFVAKVGYTGSFEPGLDQPVVDFSVRRRG